MRLRRASPKTGARLSYRQISACPYFELMQINLRPRLLPKYWRGGCHVSVGYRCGCWIIFGGLRFKS